MRYLIDTDMVIDTLDALPDTVRLLERLTADGAAISIITYAEICQGILESPTPEDAQATFERFLAGIPVLPFSSAVAWRFARLRSGLMRQGKRVRTRVFDLVIAATALEHGLELVTRNTDDYKDIPGLTRYQL